MNKFSGYDTAEEVQCSSKLPPGAYVCSVLNVKYEEGKNGYNDRIAIQFDIAEGEQKGFFRKQYDSNTYADKKWKGSVRVYVPKDDGSERDGWTKRTFKDWIRAFENSNSGYVWDWDESKWKGKIVGIVFGTTGTVINGRSVTYTEPRYAVEVGKVRDGSAQAAKFKSKNGYRETGSETPEPTIDENGFMQIPDGVNEEIPF